MKKITDSQRAALTWLRSHGGDGLFAKDGVLLAAGERAPFMRTTWNLLRDQGLAEFYGTGRGRLRLTEQAKKVPGVPAREIAARQECMSPHRTDDDYPENAAHLEETD